MLDSIIRHYILLEYYHLSAYTPIFDPINILNVEMCQPGWTHLVLRGEKSRYTNRFSTTSINHESGSLITHPTIERSFFFVLMMDPDFVFKVITLLRAMNNLQFGYFFRRRVFRMRIVF